MKEYEHQKAELHGGTHDGEHWPVYAYQTVLYVHKYLSIEESQSLVDSCAKGITWKAPEEVYYRKEPGHFYYDRTVEYKPRGLN